MHQTAIIILAAGQSARLGSPKQLLPFRGKILLQHVAEEAVQSGAGLVVVVTGAYATEITAALNVPAVEIVWNAQWEQGKGVGIACGVQHVVTNHPEITRIILSVCDQPYVSADLFQQLFTTQQSSDKGIVASAYTGTLGTPVLLTRPYFDQLQALTQDAGAKQILQAHRDDVATLPFPEGVLDIDTKEDYDAML